MTSVYDFSAQDIRGNAVGLSSYRGKVLLIVNTASKCGLTPQYKGLQELYEKYREQGLEVLGFPCNQFAHQEPGDASDISEFCEISYGVDFPLFDKVDVNGGGAHPLYKHLKEAAPGLLGSKAIKWNFTKFLLDREGHVVKRYAPTDTPESLESDIRTLL